MKYTILTILLSCSLGILHAQRLNDTIIKKPDGITIGYFNSETDTCLPRIFIGNELKILFPCYNDGDYERIDIGLADTEIKRLQELLTSEYILKLNKCCYKKGCPDTIHGYYLMVKHGNKYESQYLDFKYTKSRKCGSEELQEIIELLKILNKKYR